MKQSEFRVWLAELDRLTRGQREELKQHLGGAVLPAPSVGWLEEAREAICPRCGAPKPHRWGHQAQMQRFRCRGCGRTFTRLSGTPLARLSYKDRRARYSEALIEGLSVRGARGFISWHDNHHGFPNRLTLGPATAAMTQKAAFSAVRAAYMTNLG